MSAKKQAAYSRGVEAENIAAGYLRKDGYEILEQRYKTVVGEIDLIASRDGGIIFVEVKAHKDVEAALYAVTEKSRRRIEAAASQYIANHPEIVDAPMRFDVIVVPPEAVNKSKTLLGAVLPMRLAHLDNAWMAGQ